MSDSQDSLFSVLGPVMIGPSSSHTAGALRIGRAAGMLCDTPIEKAVFYLHGSFAQTYKGHGSDRALAAGVLGMETDNPDIKNALDICAQQGIQTIFEPADLGDSVHPNTVKIELTEQDGEVQTIVGSSIGGGEVRIVEINGFPTAITGNYPAIVTRHYDRVGVIQNVIACISSSGINIVTINLSRSQKGKLATAIIETDAPVPDNIIRQMRGIENMVGVLTIGKF